VDLTPNHVICFLARKITKYIALTAT
jgi:hypothetical protein